MEEAWRAHIGKLTLQQLLSPEECRAHLDSFPRSVVSQGLALSPVASSEDVQDLITTFMRTQEYMVPPAASMKLLADMEREFHVGVALREIREIVKTAALEGRHACGPIDPREHADSRAGALQSRRSFTADPEWLEQVFVVLHHEGYSVTQHLNAEGTRRTGVFSLAWSRPNSPVPLAFA